MSSPTKFVSNIGWISNNSQTLGFEILNCGYLFNIPINDVSDLISGKRSEIFFSVPLSGTLGMSRLSSSGNMIYFFIDGKNFGTPVSVLNKVLTCGQRKPVSEIVERSNNQIEKYAIYDEILKSYLPSPCRDIPNELKKLEDPTKDLINKFHGNKIESLNYNDKNVQAAYMLCYFPYYIENIYHLLHYIECPETQKIFQNDLNVNLYGCGPAPDLLGLLAFLNKKYRSTLTQINVNFFDNHDWKIWRSNCVHTYSKLFTQTIKIRPKDHDINLLNCDKAEYVQTNGSNNSQLHIFQNCTTDLYNQCKSFHKIGEIFNTFSDHMPPNSIAIIIDFLGRGDSMKILNSVRKKLVDNPKVKILDTRYNVDEYTPNFIQNKDVQAFLIGCYQKSNVMPRKSTGYTYLAVQRTE